MPIFHVALIFHFHRAKDKKGSQYSRLSFQLLGVPLAADPGSHLGSLRTLRTDILALCPTSQVSV